MNIQQSYEILEIDPHASPEMVREAYEDLLQAWDPEAFANKPHLKKKAEKKLEEIHKAYRKIVSFSLSAKASDATQKRPPYEGSAADRTGPKRTKKKSEGNRGNHFRIHPWARFSARIIDYLLFTFVLLGARFFQMSIWEHVSSFFFPVVLTFLWIFVEAIMLHLFGTTPGKWIFDMEVIDRSLKKPGYRSACLRSLSVWCNGVGTGFFLISPATFAISYIRLRHNGIASWDRLGKFHIIHGKIESRRMLTVGVCISAVLMLAFQFEKKKAGPMPGMVAQQKAEKYPESMSPDSDMTPLAQANFYLLMGRYEEATRAYLSIIGKTPDLAEARYGLGVSYAKGRRYDVAIEELKEAVRLAPEYAEAHHILGLVYLASGNRDAALTQYRILVGLDAKLAEELHVYIRNMKNFMEKESTPLK